MRRYKNLIVIVVLIIAVASGYFLAKSRGTDKKTNSNKTVTAHPKEAKKAEIPKVIVNNDAIESRDFKDTELKYNDKSIPVLMYHSIADGKPDNTAVIPPSLFKEHMQYLKDNGYTTLTLTEVYNFFTQNKPVPLKSVAIVFDDGYIDNYTSAYPILKQLGFRASIFMITGAIDTSGYLSSSQLKELQNNGIDIESHTVSHNEHMMNMSYADQLKEFKDSKETLEKLLNKKVDFIAYPYGHMNSNVNNNTFKSAQEAGYTMAFTTDGRWSNKSQGLLKLDRVFIGPQTKINSFKDRISNPNYKFY